MIEWGWYILFGKQTEAANKVIRSGHCFNSTSTYDTHRQLLRATSKRILEVKELASIENKIRKLNVFWVRAGLFGLCFYRYTWLFHAGKKTKRHSSSKKAKQEETQTNKL